MNPTQIISKKRDQGELTPDEIRFFIQGFATGSIPDYQMAALAMAIYLNDMTSEETACLTKEMLESGRTLEWDKATRNQGPGSDAIYVDKHSTGGVGDKVSLVLAPVLAVCGLRVPMISGRGLGPSGGTLDKLESIPGFRTDLSLDEMQRVCDQVGCVITGASQELAPADRELYRLRDVTGTVPSIPLITASIMSKKLAEGLDALVLDVKWGSGAFMKTQQRAKALADSLVRTGQAMNLKVNALITDMNQPLGRMAGNALEVMESIESLQGGGPDDLRQLTMALGGELLRLAGQANSREAGESRIAQVLSSGQALEKFREMVAAQGGDLEAALDVAASSEIAADINGYVTAIDAEQLGYAIIEMGGGRKVKSDKIDFGVGLEMLVKLGEYVEKGQPLVRLFSRDGQANQVPGVGGLVKDAIQVGDQTSDPSLTAPQLILD